MKKLQRGLTLITALAIVAIFLAVALMMLELATHNSQNVGAGYTKQQYFDVAEAGIDRGLTDIDSNLPAPGSTSPSLTPPTPPATPSGDQTALPSIPGVLYHYSYWHNPNAQATSTPDPLSAHGFAGAGNTITVPGYGTLIWSYSISTHDGQPTGRDVGVETVATVFTSQHSSCALCAGGNVSVGGSLKGTTPIECKDPQNLNIDKICTDPSPGPSNMPTAVPMVMGGTYGPPSGNCGGETCAYGDGGVSTNNNVQTSAETGSFLDSQSTIDTLSNANTWKSMANGTSITYKNCSSGCTQSDLKATQTGYVQFLDGNLSLSGGKGSPPIQYAGLEIVNGCMAITGNAMVQGGATGEFIVLGTDAKCSGYAFQISGNANWSGGTLYTAQGSAQISGTGTNKYEIFYGDLIAAGNVDITGNGNFIWQSGTETQQYFLDQYSVDSFIQY